MSLHVQGQVVRPGEGPLAQAALERPITGVFAIVSCELIGSGKLPPTALPTAGVRLLAGMGAEVGLEVT